MQKICEQEDWDDISHARVFVGDYGLTHSTAYRLAIGGKTPTDWCRWIADRPPQSALWFAGDVSHSGQTGPDEGRKINSP